MCKLNWLGLGRVLLIAAAVCLGLLETGCEKKDADSGSFIDDRDGQKYKTVKIGNQTWMAMNLNYTPKSGVSWCYGDKTSNCDKYGRLYDWNTAKTACPKGWHLPSRDEWTELVTAAGSETAGKKLKSTSGWNENGNGTDVFGFSALPGGTHDTDGSFYNVGIVGYWWTATGDGSGGAYRRDTHYDGNYADENGVDKSNGYSVRCVKE